MPEPTDRILTLTARIVAAYVGANLVDPGALPGLIRDVRRALAGLEPGHRVDPVEPGPPEARSAARPMVEIRKSVFADHLVCLEDGVSVTMLKRHLRTAHDLTPEQYRAKWGLLANYPMVAPAYAMMRSTLAKASGLGRKGH